MPAPLIAHVVHRLDYGGLENGLVNLVNGLPTQHFRHAVICMTAASDFRRRIRRPDVEVHELHKKPGKDPGTYLRLWRLLRRLRPAMVHTRNTGVIDCQIVAFLAGVPVRIHGYHGWDVDDLAGDDLRRNFLRRACDPFVHCYVAVSRQIGAWMSGSLGIRPERIRQIHNGVDTTRFRPADPAGTANFVIGTVGRLQPVKNQALLIAACGHLSRTRPDLGDRFELRIVGDGPERDRLSAALAATGLAGRATITGWQDDVPGMLHGLSVFVLPSLNEGISNTVLEAMATGLPVIATAVGGNAELVQDEETGFLIPGGDAAALAERLARYLDSPALVSRHGSAGRLRAEREFSIARMVDDYDRLYGTLMNQRQAG